MTHDREFSLDDLAAMVAAGFHDVQGQISGLRAEVREVRGEVGGLRTEVGDVRGEVAGLRAEVREVRGEVSGLRTEVEQRFDGAERKFDRVERDLAEVKYLLTDVVRRDEFVDLKVRVETVERHLGLRS